MVSRSSIKSGWRTMVNLRQREKNHIEVPPRCASTKIPNKGNIHINSKLREKYGECTAVIGAIGENRVYTVRRQRDGSTFAIKRFGRRHQKEDEATYQRRILHEFLLGSRLRHRNIIEVFDLFEEQNHWEQVMEYAPYNLFDRVRSTKMSLEEKDCSFKQIISGVAYLHSMHLAHRDLKLENVVYTGEGVLKIIDFGTATITTLPDSDSPALANDFVGCGPYMAPEVLSRKWYRPQTLDVWSLAILYCCMVMGKFPWMLAQSSNNAFARFASWQSRTDHVPSDHTIEFCKDLSVTTQRIVKKSSAGTNCTIIELKASHDDSKPARARPEGWDSLSEGSWEAIPNLLRINCRRRWNLEQLTGSPWFEQIRVCCWKDGEDNVCGCHHEHI